MLLITKDHLIPNCNKNCPRLLNMLSFLGSHAVALGQCWKKILGFICWYCDSQCRTLSSVSFGELLNYLRKLTVDSSHDWCLLTSSLPEAQPKKMKFFWWYSCVFKHWKMMVWKGYIIEGISFNFSDLH